MDIVEQRKLYQAAIEERIPRIVDHSTKEVSLFIDREETLNRWLFYYDKLIKESDTVLTEQQAVEILLDSLEDNAQAYFSFMHDSYVHTFDPKLHSYVEHFLSSSPTSTSSSE